VRRLSNKAYGTSTERELVRLLRDNGFWAHKLVENENGAPFDVIAAKDGLAYAFEVKDLRNSAVFYLNRVEDNQITAARSWRACYNPRHFFAFRLFGKEAWVFWSTDDLLARMEANDRSVCVLADNFYTGVICRESLCEQPNYSA
jgi:Holliday junction resolvase